MNTAARQFLLVAAIATLGVPSASAAVLPITTEGISQLLGQGKCIVLQDNGCDIDCSYGSGEAPTLEQYAFCLQQFTVRACECVTMGACSSEDYIPYYFEPKRGLEYCVKKAAYFTVCEIVLGPWSGEDCL